MTPLQFRDQLNKKASSLYKDMRKEDILSKLKLIQESEQSTASSTHGESQHYQRMAIQPIQVMESWLTPEQFQGFLLGSILKYLGRYNQISSNKGGIKDLRKAMDYLEWLMDSITDEDQEN